MSDHEPGRLLFARYAGSEFGYSEFQKLVVPLDPKLQTAVLRRDGSQKLSYDTEEILKRLCRAHLSLAQAQEYIRQRLRTFLKQE
jgi:hypothetical protein